MIRLSLLVPSAAVIGGCCFYLKNYATLSVQQPERSQILSALFVLFAIYFTYHLFLHPLASLPGPLVARLGIPFWQTWQAWKLTHGPALKALHDRYGDTVRIGPNSLSTIDPDAVRAIYSHGTGYKKSNIYSAFRNFVHTSPI